MQLRKAAVDNLSLSQASKNEAKATLDLQANLQKALNDYRGATDHTNTTNQSYSSAYSWTNGVVGGLGAALAAIDKKRNWGPVAGGVGAAWNLLGLTLQKAFVDPKVSSGTTVTQSIESLRSKYDAASDAWYLLVNATAADTQNKYTSWLTATREANSQAATVLHVEQTLHAQ